MVKVNSAWLLVEVLREISPPATETVNYIIRRKVKPINEVGKVEPH